MILSVEQDGKDVIQGSHIMHTIVEEFVYGAPLIFKIGINDTTMHEEHLVQGSEYLLTTMFGTQVMVVLGDILPFSNESSGSALTEYTFYEIETYKLLHNLFPPESEIWGVLLKRHIVGNQNQLDVVMIELRKMGLMVALGAGLSILQKHVLEYLEGEPRHISNIQKVKTEKTVSKRNNYSMITDGETGQTITGSNSSIFIPMMREEHILAFDMKIEPKYIIVSSDANADILLGSTVEFKQLPYCVMEKTTVYEKDRVTSVITLGYVPFEANT